MQSHQPFINALLIVNCDPNARGKISSFLSSNLISRLFFMEFSFLLSPDFCSIVKLSPEKRCSNELVVFVCAERFKLFT